MYFCRVQHINAAFCMNMNLSVAVITFNEERIIEKLLKSVENFADEIIIVDSFSTDKTEQICKKFSKTKFIERQFDGFGTQKNYAIDQCSGKWILFLDADEIPDEKAKTSINKIVNSEKNNFEVYKIEFNNVFLGKILKHGGWGNTWRERFFMKGSGKYSEDIVHENFKTNKKIGKLEGKLFHYTYKDIHHHIEKTNKYTSMMAKKLFDRGKKSGVLKVIFKPSFQFIKSYFLKLGFLDGIEGYYMARTASAYTFLKYMKLYEITKNQ